MVVLPVPYTGDSAEIVAQCKSTRIRPAREWVRMAGFRVLLSLIFRLFLKNLNLSNRYRNLIFEAVLN
jgi:hypothetical protein